MYKNQFICVARQIVICVVKLFLFSGQRITLVISNVWETFLERFLCVALLDCEYPSNTTMLIRNCFSRSAYFWEIFWNNSFIFHSQHQNTAPPLMIFTDPDCFDAATSLSKIFSWHCYGHNAFLKKSTILVFFQLLLTTWRKVSVGKVKWGSWL